MKNFTEPLNPKTNPSQPPLIRGGAAITLPLTRGSRRGFASAFALLLFATIQTAQAAPSATFSCVALGRAGLQIKSGTTVHEVPIRLQSCEGVIALSDGLSMCYINERRERRCKELHKGEAVTRDAIGVTASSGFAENVVAMARGDVQTLPGQSRTKPPRIAGLPFGQVIGEGGNLVFDFSVDKHMANAERVSITDDTDNASPLWETAITSATVKFQVNSIKTDTWYRWIAQVGERKFNGRFLLVGAALDAARIELQRLEADTGLTPQAKAFLKADVLNEYGLVHERDLALGEQRGLALGHGSK